MRAPHFLACSVALWILVGIVPNAMAQQKKSGAQEKETGAAAYDDFVEPWRSRFIKGWENAVKSAKEEIKSSQQLARKAKSKAYGNRVTAAKHRLALLEKNNPLYIPTLSSAGLSPGLQVGQYGRLSEYIEGKVIQVIGKERMIVALEATHIFYGNGHVEMVPAEKRDRWLPRDWILLKCSTAGITDDKFIGTNWDEIIGNGTILIVTGTTTYATAGGGTKTVPVVETVRLESLKTKKEKKAN